MFDSFATVCVRSKFVDTGSRFSEAELSTWGPNAGSKVLAILLWLVSSSEATGVSFVSCNCLLVLPLFSIYKDIFETYCGSVGLPSSGIRSISTANRSAFVNEFPILRVTRALYPCGGAFLTARPAFVTLWESVVPGRVFRLLLTLTCRFLH